MKLAHLLSINAVLALAFGIAFTLYGPLMVAFFGIPDIPEDNVLLYWNTVAFARMFGVALFSFGLLLWALRSIIETQVIAPIARRGILSALLLGHAMGLFASLTQQNVSWLTPAGWVMSALFALLLVGYGYFMVASTERRDPSKA